MGSAEVSALDADMWELVWEFHCIFKQMHWQRGLGHWSNQLWRQVGRRKKQKRNQSGLTPYIPTIMDGHWYILFLLTKLSHRVSQNKAECVQIPRTITPKNMIWTKWTTLFTTILNHLSEWYGTNNWNYFGFQCMDDMNSVLFSH